MIDISVTAPCILIFSIPPFGDWPLGEKRKDSMLLQLPTSHLSFRSLFFIWVAQEDIWTSRKFGVRCVLLCIEHLGVLWWHFLGVRIWLLAPLTWAPKELILGTMILSLSNFVFLKSDPSDHKSHHGVFENWVRLVTVIDYRPFSGPSSDCFECILLDGGVLEDVDPSGLLYLQPHSSLSSPSQYIQICSWWWQTVFLCSLYLNLKVNIRTRSLSDTVLEL